MKEQQKLTTERLKAAIADSFAALRIVSKLRPIEHDSAKLFPPTYAVEDKAANKYAQEQRIVDGQPINTVLLDSVQSQANRMELALLRAYDEGCLDMPMVQVKFPANFSDIGRITVLDAPHRIADAIFRDSLVPNPKGKPKPWPQSDESKRFAAASVKDASALLELCPTALVFGVWHSTGDLGGLGTKFARALVSEIVGFGAIVGQKTASRIDPLGIEKKNITIYEHETDVWTPNKEEAAVDKGNPRILKSKDGTGDGSPSAINHGNIPPSIDTKSGGVSIQYALQTTVLSLTRFRMLRFGDKPAEAQNAARTYLAALGIAAIACGRDEGYWLRSRCELSPIPDESKPLELVKSNGTTESISVPSAKEACDIVNAAAAEARKHKLLPEKGHVLDLIPSEKLLKLIALSRGLNAEA